VLSVLSVVKTSPLPPRTIVVFYTARLQSSLSGACDTRSAQL
jgi:hypothetical protein